MIESIVVLDGYTLTPSTPGCPAAKREPCWDELGRLGSLTVYTRTRPDQVKDRIANAAIVLTNKTVITAADMESASRLRYIGVMATGVNVVDLNLASMKGVSVTNVPGYGTDSVAQHVFALLFEITNHVAAHHKSVSAGGWSSCPDFSYTVSPLTELAGKTLGIVGLGSIGRRVATIGRALGMKIVAAHQRSMAEIKIADVEWMSVDQLISCADVLTLHCPLTDQTRGMINRERLSQMKSTSILINTGRGPLIDESALAEALAEGWIAGAGLDVLSQEPPVDSSPLLGAPHCVITPHISWASCEARCRLMETVTSNVQAFMEHRPVNLVGVK